MQPGAMTPDALARSMADDYRLDTLPDLKAPTILDVGAHEGGFVRLALARWPDALVYAFEPHPESYRKLAALRATLLMASMQAAIVHPREGRGMVRLYEGVNGTHEASTRADVRWPHCSQDLSRWHDVPALDAASLPAADVVKIDTEGCEVEILEGYPHLATVKVLLVEPHAVGGDYAGQERRIREIAREAGLREVGKGIAWRFAR
jgi:FkbM family methyltransferase